MAMQRIKKGDEVIVLAGKDKGRRGRITRRIGNRVYVEGVNMVKKHVKPDPNRSRQGGIMDQEAPIAISNVALYNAVTKKADKVGFKTLEDGRKMRVFRSTGEMVDI